MTTIVSDDFKIQQILEKSKVKTESVEDLDSVKEKLEKELGQEVHLRNEESGDKVRVLKTLIG
jgi:nucleotidyltransferase/DNA polymerase involved in DNA repair